MVRESKVIKEDLKIIARDMLPLTDKLAGKTLLITGGAGFLGKYFLLTLKYLNDNVLQTPCKVIVLDNFITGLKENIPADPNIELIQHDVTKPFDTDQSINYIIHAASLASPIFYNKFRLETIDVGFTGTRNMLELARKKNVESFLFTSSSEVYGDPDPQFIPTNENYLGRVSCTGPRACYDEPKRIGETLCMTYADVYNLPVKIVRPFNVFGPGMRLDDGRVVPNFVVAALKGEQLPVHGNGRYTRTFCYITDAMVGFFQILLSNRNREAFNIGADTQEIEMKHLAEMVVGLVENEGSEIMHMDKTIDVYSIANPNRRCPDLTKIRTMVGYSPRVSLITGLKRFIAWAKEEMEASGPIYQLETSCKICGNKSLNKIISLGKTPLANNLINSNEVGKEELFPLEVMYCPKCHLCQLSYVASPEKLFKHYVYVSSTTETFRRHFADLATKLVSKFNLGKNSLAVDVGSNDGIMLKEMRDRGVRVVGIEPANNLAAISRDQGLDVVNDFINSDSVEKIVSMKGQADVVTAANVFAHVADIHGFLENTKKLIKRDGVFVVEVQYLLDSIKNTTFDNIYHEHLYYYSVLSLNELVKKHGMEIFDIEHITTHGGSIRAYIQNKGTPRSINGSVQMFLEEEKRIGLDKLETYERFAEQIYTVRDSFKAMVKKIKLDGGSIAGYGAPAKATTLLNFCGIDSNSIDYIVEDNPLKHGLIIPGVKIPIVSKDKLKTDVPDYLAIFAWNFAQEIMKNNSSYKDNGGKFILPLPKPSIL